MEYYDPIDRGPRRIAAVVTVVVVAVVATILSFVTFVLDVVDRREPPVEIVFEDEVLEEPTPKPVKQQSAPTDQRRDKAPAHETEAKSESSRQTSGEAEKTETINPAALFKPVVGNSSESVPEGNRLAPDGEKEQNKGEGAGYNLQGTDQLDEGLQGRGLREGLPKPSTNQLDEGLQGRGLREGLPKPSTNYNKEGIVVVRVEVDSDGNVTHAQVDLSGSTTTDATLHSLAVEAAKKAKFKPSERTVQGGTITYVFKLQ
ncbi:MAG: energy transducer TonB [Alistipes sp.]|nr:energy transducer TonB [Alistipes sp.]